KDDPINIIRNIVKGFDVAYPHDAYTGEDTTADIRGAEITPEDRKAWSNPKHPSRPELQLLDEYPVLPDLDAFPDTGNYMVIKFVTNPLPASDTYDTRLDVALMQPHDFPDAQARYDEKVAQRATDPTLPAPLREYDYDLYLNDTEAAVRGLKRKLDVADPDKDDPALYEHNGADASEKGFEFHRVRAYEASQQTGDGEDFFSDTVAVALHDPDTAAGKAQQRLQKGAYFYPVMQRVAVRPKRIMTRMIPSQAPAEEEGRVDVMNVKVREPGETTLEMKEQVRAKYDVGSA
ncbi:hypothetical protein LTR66_015446, partial [Elasticomyces elasticus]